MTQILVEYLNRLKRQPRTILLTCVYGLGAGGAAVAFQVGINLVYAHAFKNLAQGPKGIFLLTSLVVILSTAALVGLLLERFCPEAAGSGIPQLKLAFWKDFGYVGWRTVWVKFVAGILSIGGGNSLGREGPSVHLAGGLGSILSGLAGEAKQNRRRGAAAGAAAGLAAAFNTPLAAITFVLEEVIEDLNSRFLGSVILASVIGALVVHGLIGKQPAFTLSAISPPSWAAYLLTPLVAALASVTGAVFQKGALWLRPRRRFSGKIPGWSTPVLGGLVTWIVGSAVFLGTGHLGIFSLGYDDLSAGLDNQLNWKIALLLLVAKLVATIACYGFGGCGGIFSPTLFFGGMCGIALAGLADYTVPLSPSDHILLAVVGMSTCLGAAVRAPVTGILIVFEMTHEFALVPALMVGALISQAVGRRLDSDNFYEAVLAQDGHQMERVVPPRDLQTWLQLPVSAITNFRPVLLSSIDREQIEKVLQAHPYQRFPVLIDNTPAGILTRKEAATALAQGRSPQMEPAVWCEPTQTIGALQALLIESASGIVLVRDAKGGRLLGIVTLHDILRAELSVGRNS